MNNKSKALIAIVVLLFASGILYLSLSKRDNIVNKPNSVTPSEAVQVQVAKENAQANSSESAKQTSPTPTYTKKQVDTLLQNELNQLDSDIKSGNTNVLNDSDFNF